MKFAVLFALYAGSSDGTAWLRHVSMLTKSENTYTVDGGAANGATGDSTAPQCHAGTRQDVDRRRHREVDHPPPHAPAGSAKTTTDAGCGKVDYYRQLRPTRRDLRNVAALDAPVELSLG
ncbi:MAG: hypothetical protein AAGE01_13570 [Pseudomonadota bacterium]